MNIVRKNTFSVAKRFVSSVPAGSYLSLAEVTERVITITKQIQSCPDNVKVDSYFTRDLDFDSLIRKSLNQSYGDEFRVKVSPKDAESFLSVDDVVKYFASHPKAR
jgi:acyl carrier protein